MNGKQLKRAWKGSGSRKTLKVWARKEQPGECSAWLRRKAGR